MRITLVTHSMYPESIGGREKYVYYLADALGKLGHEVKVFTCIRAFYSKVKKYQNFTVYYLPSFDIPLKQARYRIPIALSAKLLLDDSDVVHAHDLHHFTTLVCAIVTKIRNKPLIVTEHGYPPLYGLMGFLIKIYDKSLVRLIENSTSNIIGVSDFISKELQNRYGIRQSKISTLYNAIDSKNFTSHSYLFKKKYSLRKKKIILSVGRLTREKGFQNLILSFKKISRKFPDTVLVIIGPKTKYKIVLDNLVKKLGLSGKIIFTGPLDDSMVKSAINCCEMVVIPSLYEPFGLIALEALSCKKLIIASNTGGLSEIFVHRVNGLLVKPGDSVDLERKIELLLSDKKMRNTLIQNSGDTLKKFNWNSFIHKMENIYEKTSLR